MNKPSKSPDRFTFQKNNYLERKADEGRTPDNDDTVRAMVEHFDSWLLRAEQDAVDPKWQQNNLEYDLRVCDWILGKVRTSDKYAQNLYAALCNNDFRKRELWPQLAEQNWSCTWRYAGGIIADMREEGDYIDWYCSGIGDGLGNGDSDGSRGYVPEGTITEEINNDLYSLGWLVVTDEN